MLGAVLLSRDALGAVIEAGLRYDDFYKPAHQHIFDVAVAVSQSGGPVDTITVAEELSRLGLLEQVGGVESLHALQNATPAISNAASYARIVQDAAMLRRLILVAADISETRLQPARQRRRCPRRGREPRVPSRRSARRRLVP